MANSIFAQLGFNFNKSTVTNTVNAVNVVKDSIISIGPVFSSIEKKLDVSSHITKWIGLGNAISGAFGGVKSIVTSVAGDIKKIYDFVDGYAQKGDKVAKTSRLVGLSVKDYQALSSAAMDSGMSVEAMDSALKKFNVNLGKARDGDKKLLQSFSVSLFGEDADSERLKGLKNNREVLIALASSFSKLQSSEQKALVSSELFGKSGLQMSEILSQGGESLEKFLNAYDKGFSEEGASNAEAFTHEFQKMYEEFEQIKMSVAMDLFPVFKDLFTAVSDMLHGGSGDELKKQFKELGESVGKFVKDLLPRIPRILDTIIAIVDALSPEVIVAGGVVLSILPAVAQIVTGLIVMKPLISIIGAGLSTIATWGSSFVLAIKASVAILGGTFFAALGGVLVLFAEIAYIVKQFYDNWDMWCSFVNHELTDAVNDWVYMFVEDVKWLWGGFKSIFVDPILNFIDALPQAFSDLWDGFKTGAMAAVSTVKDLLKSLPLVGNLFGDSNSVNDPNGVSTSPAAPSQIASAVQQSYSVTTNRFAVDFNNVPRGTNITPPPQGDFDWSRSYTLAGAV